MLRLFLLFIAIVASVCFHIRGFSNPKVIDSSSDNIASSVQYGLIGAEKLHLDFKEHIKFSSEKPNLIGYINFGKSHLIDEASYFYVVEALKVFKEAGVSLVIVHLNTLGGALFPSIKIADLFQKFDVNESIPLIAFIDKYAIGSSTMLAYACRFIAVTEGAFMGGQIAGQKLRVQALPESLMPYIINEYASLAGFYGRDAMIAVAMADMRMIVVERDGKLVGFYSPLDIRQNVPNPDEVLSTEENWLTLDANQLLKYGVADFLVSSETVFVLKQKTPFSEIPLSQEPYLSTINNAEVIPYSGLGVTILLLLSRPIVSGLLLLGVVVFFYLQIKIAKFCRYSILSLVFLTLIIISSFGIQAISWIEALFLIFGLTVITLDLILTKGSNLIGFFGIGLTVFSLFIMLLPGFEKFSLLDFEAFSFAAGSLATRVVFLISSLILSLIIIIVIEKKFGNRFEKKRIKEDLLFEDPIKEKDFIGKIEDKALPKEGSEGYAHCSLRPFGKVVIQDRIYDAVSFEDKVILKKTSIIVVDHQNGKIVVKEK